MTMHAYRYVQHLVELNGCGWVPLQMQHARKVNSATPLSISLVQHVCIGWAYEYHILSQIVYTA